MWRELFVSSPKEHEGSQVGSPLGGLSFLPSVCFPYIVCTIATQPHHGRGQLKNRVKTLAPAKVLTSASSSFFALASEEPLHQRGDLALQEGCERLRARFFHRQFDIVDCKRCFAHNRSRRTSKLDLATFGRERFFYGA